MRARNFVLLSLTLSLSWFGQTNGQTIGQTIAQTIDFEDVTLDVDSAMIGPVEADFTDVDDGFGATNRVGTIASGGAQFVNRHNLMWASWSGFSISNRTDNETPGWTPEPNVITGAAFDGSNYASAFGYSGNLDANDAEQLNQLPYFDLPTGHQVMDAQITNTTYSALSMQEGDAFAKKFGGDTGDDADFFLLSIFGTQSGTPLSESVDVYLADYRSADNSEDFILRDWLNVDLTPLSDADRLHFNLSSSDVGSFGMNTPAYFAIDAITLQETSSIVGDVSGDGVLTVEDVDAVCSAIASMSVDRTFDVNGDGSVSHMDVDAVLNAANRLPGDADFDGEVGFTDFLTLSANFGGSASWSTGDFDCDLEAQFSDFLVLSENYGELSQSATASSVPEPDAGWTMLAGLMFVLLYRKRK